MSYSFPAGPITMAEVVRYANEHGLVFSGATCEARLSGLSDVEAWRDNGNTLMFIAVMNVSGYLYPSSNDAKPANVLLDIAWAGGWGINWNTKVGAANSYIAAQNDPTDNLKRNIHGMYTISGSGSRLATSTDEFVATASVDMTDLDLVYSSLQVELSLFDIVDTTTGLL